MLVIGTSWTGTPDHTSFQSDRAHFAVQFADAIRVPAQTQRENGHAERLIWIEPRLAE